ncbi:Putative transcriptional regulator%2C GntR family [Mycobacterium tuberculosis]|uniref:Transcriptional regulator, GntR family n=1 Tax=Mycobacterium tuberculosis TaxID=1773 RepID=A0A654U5D1_MYCTX|nr:Putative transcriptional regulator%2C GntR family [Mycobacterium tuberculosis]
MMLPAPTTDSCAEPPLTNFAGARFSDSPRIGHRLLYRLNTGCTDTRSICAS